MKNTIQYLQRLSGKNAEQLGSLAKDNALGDAIEEAVSKVSEIEYKHFCASAEGRKALKQGGIEKSWLEYLLGAGAVNMYNAFSKACGGALGVVTLESEKFSQVKEQVEADIQVNEFKRQHKDGCNPVDDIVKNGNLSKDAKMQLLTEHVTSLVQKNNISILQDISLEKAMLSILRGKENKNELLEACKQSGDIDLTSPVIKKTSTHAEKALAAIRDRELNITR